jgi:DNA-binding MarR family transcriptional regulator
MTTYPTLSTRVIGQAEKTLGAILDRLLEGTAVTEPQWVILTLVATGGGTADRDRLTHQVAGALKLRDADAQARIAELVANGMLRTAGGAISVTDAGQQLHSRVRTAVTEITERLWGDLPEQDLATAGRVLTIITERANAELASA